MSIKVAFLIDNYERIKPQKDSSVAMMLEAQRRQWTVYCLLQNHLSLQPDGRVYALADQLNVVDSNPQWYEPVQRAMVDLSQMDVLFMRKDPPMDMNYIYSTYLLELLERQGVVIVNKPQALRDVNEKLYTAWFPQCCVETLVSADMEGIRNFLVTHGDIIVKPLGAMGGASIFRIRKDDPNINVILETLTDHGKVLTMAQRYIAQITEGDKRLILVDGQPIPFALARIPKPGETRGNLAAGARAEGRPLTDRDMWLCAQVGPACRERGLLFVGMDVIGDYITEINVTSPTGIRELDHMFQLNISATLMDAVVAKLAEIPT